MGLGVGQDLQEIDPCGHLEEKTLDCCFNKNPNY